MLVFDQIQDLIYSKTDTSTSVPHVSVIKDSNFQPSAHVHLQVIVLMFIEPLTFETLTGRECVVKVGLRLDNTQRERTESW